MTDLLAALKADPAMPKALEMDEFLSQDVNCDVVTLEVANSYADACMVYAYRKGLEEADAQLWRPQRWQQRRSARANAIRALRTTSEK